MNTGNKSFDEKVWSWWDELDGMVHKAIIEDAYRKQHEPDTAPMICLDCGIFQWHEKLDIQRTYDVYYDESTGKLNYKKTFDNTEQTVVCNKCYEESLEEINMDQLMTKEQFERLLKMNGNERVDWLIKNGYLPDNVCENSIDEEHGKGKIKTG